MSDKLDFLSGREPVAETLDAPVTQDGPSRGPDGRFAAGQPSEPAPVEPVPEPAEQAVKPEPGHVPLSAMLDERDKRQALEKRLAEVENRQQAEPQPERYVDPDTENLVLQTRLNLSEDLARDKFGDEAVEAAKTAAIQRFQTNPAFQAEVLAQRNPYKYVVEWHKREQRLAELPSDDDWTQYQAWKAAGGTSAAPPAQQTQGSAATAAPPAPPPPPRSLAAAPSAGGTQGVATAPAGPGVAFDNLFQR